MIKKVVKIKMIKYKTFRFSLHKNIKLWLLLRMYNTNFQFNPKRYTNDS